MLCVLPRESYHIQQPSCSHFRRTYCASPLPFRSPTLQLLSIRDGACVQNLRLPKQRQLSRPRSGFQNKLVWSIGKTVRSFVKITSIAVWSGDLKRLVIFLSHLKNIQREIGKTLKQMKFTYKQAISPLAFLTDICINSRVIHGMLVIFVCDLGECIVLGQLVFLIIVSGCITKQLWSHWGRRQFILAAHHLNVLFQWVRTIGILLNNPWAVFLVLNRFECYFLRCCSTNHVTFFQSPMPRHSSFVLCFSDRVSLRLSAFSNRNKLVSKPPSMLFLASKRADAPVEQLLFTLTIGIPVIPSS